MTEIWKDIPGYEGLYQVSNLGQVRSLNYNHTGHPGILSQGNNGDGYKHVILYKNNSHKKGKVHRLVALAFLENPNNLPFINHKDENKGNNRVDNLEWCSRKYNVNYGTAIQRKKEHSYIPVNCYDKRGKLIKSYKSIKQTEEDGFYSQGVVMCCKGQIGSHHGCFFRYADIQGREAKNRDKYIS